MSECTNSVVEDASYNNVNELVSRSGTNGLIRFRGSVNEPISNATVAGKQAIVDSGTNFTGYANIGSGISTVQVQVSDFTCGLLRTYSNHQNQQHRLTPKAPLALTRSLIYRPRGVPAHHDHQRWSYNWISKQ
ncbi:MAG TPA: hypothetical protein VMP11_02300 [Verrucomicrobiae bacterium]|nr:hypothetical protein [Verrucomicrobiae bacterium]